MKTVTIEQTNVTTQKIVSAVLKTSKDIIPQSIKDEATRNQNGDYSVTEIHETSFELNLKSQGISHSDELPCFYPTAKLDFTGQDGQVIIGLRQESVETFWIQNGSKTRIQNLEGPQPECVDIGITDSVVEIKFRFHYPDPAVSNFEFTFKLQSTQIF